MSLAAGNKSDLILERLRQCMLLVALAVTLTAARSNAQERQSAKYADFVEPNFPFITATVVADSLSDFTPAYNWTVRCIIVQLGSDAYMCFDPDLLRMSVAWTGDFITMRTMAQVSYQDPSKGNANPRVLGKPIVANGMYAGWMGSRPVFQDPRTSGENPLDPGKGPLPKSFGTWNGLYVHGDRVVLSYEVRGTRIFEQPGLLSFEGERAVTRTFQLSRTEEPLTLIAAEIPDAVLETRSDGALVLSHGADSVTAVAVSGEADLELAEGRYVVADIEEDAPARSFRIALWTGPRSRLRSFRRAAEGPVGLVDGFTKGGPVRWAEEVETDVEIAPDTNAFVFDHYDLPIPNPWRRNVRPADIDFFRDGRAAVVTFDGDVWIVSGLSGSRPVWRRFASGLYESLALAIDDDQLLVYGREGIVRLHDLNDDGEADFYEAFAPGVVQSTISREWPFDLVVRPEGGYFASQGGALHSAADREKEPVMPGFLPGSIHNGSILEISEDGKTVDLYATGFRGHYLGIHPETGMLTASDQQGNFVPSTPIYVIRENGFYGVPATSHLPDPLPPSVPPLTWIPHQVDPSGTIQVWLTTDEYGPLNGHMVHLSYGRSGLFRVYVDSSASPIQGGVAPLPDDKDSPTMKAALHPENGLLYLVGFKGWGTSSGKLGSLRRMRYTGRPSSVPTEVRAGRQGIVLQFEDSIEEAAPPNFRVKRWNYLRSGEYGSGHYRLDESPGEEELRVAAVHRSQDGRAVLLVLPGMRKVMQMSVDYQLARSSGDAFDGSAYLTVNDVHELDLARFGFGPVALEADLEAETPATAVAATPPLEPTANKGRHLFQEMGCVACHSTDGSEAGMFGPTFHNLFGATRPIEDGREVTADEDYIRRAILDPGAEIVRGYAQEMPSFKGILGEPDVESIVLFIKSLSEGGDTASGQK